MFCLYFSDVPIPPPCADGDFRLHDNYTNSISRDYEYVEEFNGLLEICFNGSYHGVCSGNYNKQEIAEVVCSSLGYSGSMLWDYCTECSTFYYFTCQLYITNILQILPLQLGPTMMHTVAMESMIFSVPAIFNLSPSVPSPSPILLTMTATFITMTCSLLVPIVSSNDLACFFPSYHINWYRFPKMCWFTIPAKKPKLFHLFKWFSSVYWSIGGVFGWYVCSCVYFCYQ